ncbi:ABC transporter permease [Candidatus Saccharibacteria bacterium]|nr:MAG: ABC transporter permease [Candidatus Saccharibacteria bacterium]
MGRRTTTTGRIIRTGFLYFVRNAWLAVAAMATMIITLSIILFSIIVNATFANQVDQITNKIDISVYLKDTVTPAQAKSFVAKVERLSNVEQVTYLDKAAALRAFIKQNSGNDKLLAAVNETDNPLPATVKIKPKDLNKMDEIRSFVTKPEWQKLQSDPISDSGERRATIDKITHATNILQRAGIIAVAVFALISVLIIFNTIQMAIFNRRDELQIMRLLGASTGYIRAPFVVETVIYGVFSAIISILIINALFITASSSLQATSLGLLEISYSQQYFQERYWQLLLMQLTLGILIGAASSMIATQRYLKFKTPKK